MKTNFILLIAKGVNADAAGIQKVNADTLLANILNMAYYIGGSVAVIVIVFAGIMYVASAGDAGRITRAKNMILYAVVGLIVILAAFAITNFVIGRF